MSSPRSFGRDGLLNVLAAACQQACLLLSTLVVARLLGPGDLGRYVIVYAALVLLGIVSQVGLRAAVIRLVAQHLATGDGDRVRSVIRFVGGLGLAAAVVAALALGLSAHRLADAFGDPRLASGFLAVAVALPGCALRDLSLAATQGWRSQRAFAVVGWILEPVGRLVGIVVVCVAGLGIDGVFVVLTAGSWVAGLAGALALARQVRGLPRGRARPAWREVLGFSWASWGTTLAASGLIWLDTLLLGALAGADEVGVYTTATRLVGLAVFVLGPVDALFAPHFAHSSASGDRAGLATAYRSAVGWGLRLSLPAFVVLVVWTAPLLGVFGAEFRTGVTVTLVLVGGQLVNALTGPAGSVLNMSGHVRVNLVDNVSALVLNLVLNLLLIPPYGMVGAAWAWAISLVSLNLVKAAQVALLERVVPFDLTTAKALASALGAGLVALLVRAAGGDSLGVAVLGAVVVLAVYLAATLALRLGEEERETIRGVLHGGGGRP